MTDTPVHLMIPNWHPPHGVRGTAEFACNLDGSREVEADMYHRTLQREKATCGDCLTAEVPR